MEPATCPNSDELRRFVRCSVTEQQAESITEHLGVCPSCEETVVGLERNGDTVADHIRRAAAEPTFSHEPECQQLMALLLKKAPLHGPTAVSNPLESPIIQSLRDYQILAKLGEGGMGAVYKAVHQRLKKTVALKVLPTNRIGDQSAVVRFEREMSVLGQLNHPNIVQALDAGEHDNQHYLVMEYVEGADLSEIVRRCSPLSIADACELISQAATGLQYAHEHGFVHRDIKPSNLMLAKIEPRGSESQAIVKILDLGLARALDQPIDPTIGKDELTTTGQVMGTLDYMAPEQGGDAHQVDIRADIYSLGATLYKLLTGDSPYAEHAHKPTLQRLMAIVQHDPPAIRSKRPDIPEKLAAVVHRMLSKNPASRYAEPAEVAQDLKPYCSGADLATLLIPTGATRILDKRTLGSPSIKMGDVNDNTGRRRRTTLFGFAAFVLLAVVVLITTRNGSVEVTSADGKLPDDVKVVVSRGGEEVELLQADNKWSARIVNGEYQVHLRGRDDRFEIKDSRLIVTRMGRAIVEVQVKSAMSTSASEKRTSKMVNEGSKNASYPKTNSHSTTPDKPFTILRDGRVLREFKTWAGALEQAQNGDTFEVNGRGPYELPNPPFKHLDLSVRASQGSRPELRLSGANVHHNSLKLIGVDLVMRTTVMSPGVLADNDGSTTPIKHWEIRKCRIAGDGIGVCNGSSIRVSDSLLLMNVGVPGEGNAEFDNNVIVSLRQAFGYSESEDWKEETHLTLTNNTVVVTNYPNDTPQLFRFGHSGKLPPKRVHIKARNNLFAMNGGPVWGQAVFAFSTPEKNAAAIDWQGEGNLYCPHPLLGATSKDAIGKEVVEHPLDAWAKTLNQTARESKSQAAAWPHWQLAAPRWADAEDYFATVRRQIETTIPQDQRDEVGPQWALIGPGDAYVRALAEAGTPVAKNDLHPEALIGGPCVILRDGKEVQGFPKLQDAIEVSMNNDVIELRTDRNVGGVWRAVGNRRLTIRAGAGYSPEVENIYVVNDFSVDLEGLRFAPGATLAGYPGDETQTVGQVSRIVNCAFQSGEVVVANRIGPISINSLNGVPRQPLIIKNCLLDGAAVLGSSIDQPIRFENSVLASVYLVRAITDDSEAAQRILFNRCAVWSPEPRHGRSHLLDIHPERRKRLDVESHGTVFETHAWVCPNGLPLMWTGSKNLFRVRGDYSFTTPVAPDQTRVLSGLDDLRSVLQSDLDSQETRPIVWEPTQWKLLPSSPGFQSGPDGQDIGANIDRLLKAITISDYREAAHVAEVDVVPAKRSKSNSTDELPPVAPTPEVVLQDHEKPFVVISPEGKELAEFKFAAEAFATIPGDLILEVRGNGPFKLPEIVREKQALTIRAAKGYRPRFVSGIDAKPGVKYHWFELNDVEFTLEGCDMFVQTDGDVRLLAGNGKQWAIQGCRLVRTAYNSVLLEFRGECLRVRDSLLSSELLDLRPTSELEFVNNVLYSNAMLVLSPQADVRLQLRSNLMYTSVPFTFDNNASLQNRTEILATGNLFVPHFGGMLGGWGNMEIPPKQFIQWNGHGNRFFPFPNHHRTPGPLWAEVPDNPKAIKPPYNVEQWNTFWGNADDLTLAKEVHFEWEFLSHPDWTEGAQRFANEFQSARQKFRNLSSLGPDMSLIGAGDPYDRIRYGGDVPVKDQRPEPLEGGPFVIVRNGSPLRGYVSLTTATRDVRSGDEIEIRSDVTFRKIVVVSPIGMHIKLRAASGYHPSLSDSIITGGEWSLEGLHLRPEAAGGRVLEGTIRRLTNCSTSPSDSPIKIGLAQEFDQPVEIVNCYLASGVVVRNSEAQPKLEMKVSNSVLASITSIATDAVSLEASRCCFWSHPHPLVTSTQILGFETKSAEVSVVDSLIDASMVVGAKKLKWKGERNLYRVHSSIWGLFASLENIQVINGSLREWRTVWNSDADSETDDSVILRPELWRERKQELEHQLHGQ